MDWKQRLFDSYVSTGQTQAPHDLARQPNPYIDQLIRTHVPSDRNIAILDIACGHGRLLFQLKSKGYLNLSGVDVSKEQVHLAHRLGIPSVTCGDLFDYLKTVPDQSQDVVFLMDILEHLSPQETLDLLDAAHRVLKSSGRLIAHVPNGEGLFAMRVRYGDFTHTQAFTQQSISQVLKACRFDQIGCHEDKPLVYGLKSFVRRILWDLLTVPHRLLLAAESGTFSGILSQNLLVTAIRP